jgi:hypothetical protein
MQVIKRLAVSPAGAHQLDDPAGTSPALANGLTGIAGTQSPSHIATMAGIAIADRHRKVPVSAELGDDLLMQTALVLFDRQEQVGALLGGELKNAGEVCSASAWINTPSSSSVLSNAFNAACSWESPVSNDVCAIATPSSRA